MQRDNDCGIVITVVIAMALLPVIISTTTAANLSGTNATLAALIPLFVIISLIVVITKWRTPSKATASNNKHRRTSKK